LRPVINFKAGRAVAPGASLEGIVSKRKESAYRSGRSPDWLKMKNADAPAAKREAEEDWAKWREQARIIVEGEALGLPAAAATKPRAGWWCFRIYRLSSIRRFGSPKL
jgi:hypothetical protein